MVCKNMYYRIKLMHVVFRHASHPIPSVVRFILLNDPMNLDRQNLQRYLGVHPQCKDKNIGVYVFNPDGLFGGGEIPASEKNFIKMVDILYVPAAQGAMTQTWLATSPDLVLASPAGRGGLYDRQALRTSDPLLNDEGMTAAMWSVWLDAASTEGVMNI
ncbi:hypothetical protein DL93DRAFT_2204372 [Clavulina sp. PMI_390]|nr:hypothetical protein DL93DRAFT_2204372 [Clavulina sp. PMI_390]